MDDENITWLLIIEFKEKKGLFVKLKRETVYHEKIRYQQFCCKIVYKNKGIKGDNRCGLCWQF